MEKIGHWYFYYREGSLNPFVKIGGCSYLEDVKNFKLSPLQRRIQEWSKNWGMGYRLQIMEQEALGINDSSQIIYIAEVEHMTIKVQAWQMDIFQ
ncbi:unnamed protein product [Paramecium primaurelia]|uniref:Uncharacterized protein n=1 Tax=Paramecium primaurelia TaxID=5886 RepID=A0A8S1NZB4_PARPR|nr:unnamed protein product [Paramecium primaurelia]